MFRQLLVRLARELDRSRISYMVIGGQAVQLYGEPRLTKDIDITLGGGTEGLEQVLDLCRRLKLQVLVPDPPEFVGRTMVLPAKEPDTGIRVDFVFSFSEYERQAMGRSRAVILDGQQVRFASLEDLIVHKLVAGRPRDIEDVRTMLAKNEDCDREYVERWLAELDRALSYDLVTTFRAIETALP